MAGNVKLIDPNNANLNYSVVDGEKVYQHNGIPPYEDMYIFAELTAVKRRRTILSTNIHTDITKQTGNNGDQRVNFLGQNQDPENTAHYNQFTTNWYDGSTEREKTYEGFGINSIDVEINSSYIPQIDIEFIDIRGLAFFNRDNSPYRILFDFPPPIFFLTFKGYYGKALTYQMHLVRYNTEFKAETGNYHITAKFIAITYAPLTDIPFRYILQAPLMKDNAPPLNPNTNEPPQNTLDLILKMQNVYSQTLEIIKNDEDNDTYELAEEKLGEYDSQLDVLFGYANDKKLTDQGTPILFTYNIDPNANNQGDVRTLKTYTEYNEYLKTFQTRDIPRNVGEQLYIGYYLEKAIEVPENSNLTIEVNKRNAQYRTVLNTYQQKLIAKGKNIVLGINASDIPPAEFLWDNGDGADAINETKYIRYVGINITNYYLKLYRGKKNLEDKKLIALNNLNTKINSVIEGKLGMLPTIYNIFEIILNDVDTFFDVLKTTTVNAQHHHETYKRQIVNDPTYKDVKKESNPNDTEIFAFPLVIRQEKICNQIVEERRAPFDLSKKCDRPFPELDMVQRFIDSFLKYNRTYNQATLREDKDTQGNDKWIPFTPADSKLVTSNIHSPYFGTDGGGDGDVPQNYVEDTRLNQILRIFVTRYYLLAQNSLKYSFNNILPPKNKNDYLYDIDAEGEASKAYINLYSEAEALNLANSIINEDYAELLREFASRNGDSRKLSSPTNGFYTYLEKNLPELYGGRPEFLEFSNGEPLYVNKSLDDYEGVKIIDMGEIAERTGSDGDDFSEFIESTKSNWFGEIFRGKPDVIEDSFKFTTENVIFRPDITTKRRVDPKYRTKFLANLINKHPYDQQTLRFSKPVGSDYVSTYGTVIKTAQLSDQNIDFPQILDDLADSGNKYFFDNDFYYEGGPFGLKEDTPTIMEIWAQALSEIDTAIYDKIINYDDVDNSDYDSELAQIMYLSNFGRTLSPFNYHPLYLNKIFFSTPSVIETPEFVIAYVGLLVGIEKGDDLWNRLYEFVSTGEGSGNETGCAYVFADIYDVNNNLSIKDKEYFRRRYVRWFRDYWETLCFNVKDMYHIVNPKSCDDEYAEKLAKYPQKPGGRYNTVVIDLRECKKEKYLEYFEGNDDEKKLFEPLISRKGLICFNEITFRFGSGDIETYTGLDTVLQGADRKYTDVFFANFFNQLERKITKRKRELENEKKEFIESTGDEDIITQTYYSFKNINDKWLAGLNKNINGYPFKTNRNKGLISQFAFVDRAMNPIGDTIIDIQNLIDAKDSPDLSLFTVLSQMLSINGFEFFPLQNFMSFQENEWEDSFRIETGGKQNQHPVFVCMYIGGASSYPTGLEKYSPFKDDGITDLENPNAGDFLTEGCIPDENKDRQMDDVDEKGDMYSNIRAFKVRYGEQNQNMFYNFGVDSKEYPETNESIQILSRLAGDEGKSAPVPKAQNLYNLYENRAYKATITGWGNAMIQPTQYFQLENVPLFNGAYVILNVKHSITANKMVTTFSGTKLLKYPLPRMLNPAALVGFEGGSTDSTSLTFEDVTEGVGTAANPDQARYNSMYTLEIY